MPLRPDADTHHAWLAREVAPHADALDRDPSVLRQTLGRSAAAGLLAASAPGASGPSPASLFSLRAAAARASGTFAFLLTQHWSAVGFASQGRRGSWVERLTGGQARSGIAYAHLRRPGPTAIHAEPVAGGLRLQGTAPWMTGWDIFDHCVTAARLPDGRIITAIHSLQRAGVTADPPLRLAAFEAANTVRMHVDLVVPEADILSTEATDWLDERDAGGAARGAAFIVGTAEAGLGLLRDAVAAGRAAPDGAHDTLAHTLDQTRSRLLAALDEDPVDGLAARGDAIALAGRIAHAAVTAWAGQANLSDHAAQRVYREVLGFTVLAQTRAVQGATLAALAR